MPKTNKQKKQKKALPQMVQLSRRKKPRLMLVYESRLYNPEGIITNPVDGQRGYVHQGIPEHTLIFVKKDAVWVKDPGVPAIRRSARHAHHHVPAFTGLFSQPFRRGG